MKAKILSIKDKGGANNCFEEIAFNIDGKRYKLLIGFVYRPASEVEAKINPYILQNHAKYDINKHTEGYAIPFIALISQNNLLFYEECDNYRSLIAKLINTYPHLSEVVKRSLYYTYALQKVIE